MTEADGLTPDQLEWVERMLNKSALSGIGANAAERRARLIRLIQLSRGRCRWTELPLRFDSVSGGGANGATTHPLYAELDHREPGTNERGHDIVCHRINDAKGQMPWNVWLAASDTPAFRQWIATLQQEWTETGTLRSPASLQRKQ